MKNASVPATDFSRFHGSPPRPSRRPTRVAMPSPTARMAQAAAAMSSRSWKTRIEQQHRQGVEGDARPRRCAAVRPAGRVAPPPCGRTNRLKARAAPATMAACHHERYRNAERSRRRTRGARLSGRVRRAGARPSHTSGGDPTSPVVRGGPSGCLRWGSSACQPISVAVREGFAEDHRLIRRPQARRIARRW